jgi:polyvinyl alcohol dehydrogenase (cytochrome)
MAGASFFRTLVLGFAPAMLGVWLLSACSDRPNAPTSRGGPSTPLTGWTTYGGSLSRTFFNADEQTLTKENVSRLVPLWRFRTAAVVSAQPMVADVDLPSEPAVRLVFAPSWDGNLYALRASDGSLAWSFRFKPHPGASYPAVGSATVTDIAGRRVVFVPGGMTMYCLDAATGELIWEFDAGTGCTSCDSLTERNEIESSPAVHEGLVYFGMDVNDTGRGKGGVFAVDAERGVLRWYFDLETGATCRPDVADQIRRFDGYHSAEQLGLPPDFFATRDGCNFDRKGTTCGNVWSSVTIDAERRMLYTASSNCDTDNSPETPEPPPPMPPYDAAIFSLTLDGTPVWVWRPREVDNADLSIGGVPNLFEIEFGGARREVVGIGIKDGTYYVLDRDGTNEITGRVEPYWQTKVVEGGSIGGIIASAAVGEGKVMFSTAIGLDITNPQLPAAWTLAADGGGVLWSNPDAQPSYAPTSAIPGVAFMGSIAGTVTAYDSDTGRELVRLAVGGPVASPPAIVDGRVYVGAGIGERGGNPSRVEYQTSLIPSPISAFCIAGTEGCPENGSCDDGNPCSNDESSGGSCRNDPVADGTSCALGSISGQCRAGACILDPALCEDQNPCTRATTGPGGCRQEAVPDGTACTVNEQPGECTRATCFPLAQG